jgi:uncharacterized protein HemX
MESGDPQQPAGAQPPVESTPATGSQPAPPTQTAQEQIDGLRAWLAQVDRRLGIRSLAGALAIVLALAAGIVGVILAKNAQDESATKTEVKSLSEQVSANTEEATQTFKDQLSALSDRLDALEGRVSSVASSQRTSDAELKVAQDDIDELRGQITDLETKVDAAAQSAASSNNGGK